MQRTVRDLPVGGSLQSSARVCTMDSLTSLGGATVQANASSRSHRLPAISSRPHARFLTRALLPQATAAAPREAAATTATPAWRAAARAARSFVSAATESVMTASGTSGARASTRYRGIAHAARSIWREEGFSGFYKGIRPTVLSVAIFVGVQQAGYDLLLPQVSSSLDTAVSAVSAASIAGAEALRARLHRPRLSNDDPSNNSSRHVACSHAHQDKPAFWHSVVAGGLIGMCAQSVVHPLDTLRRRIQVTRSEWISPVRAFRQVLQRDGVRGLYRGVLAANLKVAPAVAITLAARDVVLGRLDWRS